MEGMPWSPNGLLGRWGPHGHTSDRWSRGWRGHASHFRDVSTAVAHQQETMLVAWNRVGSASSGGFRESQSSSHSWQRAQDLCVTLGAVCRAACPCCCSVLFTEEQLLSFLTSACHQLLKSHGRVLGLKLGLETIKSVPVAVLPLRFYAYLI